MAKSRRASGKAKGKKGKKGSAKAKQAPAEPAEPELQWPWMPFVRAWMAPGAHNRKQMLQSFRSHYVYSDGGTINEKEWNKILKNYCYPLSVAHEEALVQLLALVLGREATRKTAADDVDELSAALRFRHPGDHYARMLTEMERWFGKLDNPEGLTKLLNFIHMHLTMGDVLNLDSLRTFLDQACILTLGKPEQADAHSDDPFASIINTGQFHLLDEYLQRKQLRLIDLFRIFDRDSDGTLTPDEIRNGLETSGVHMAPAAFDAFIKELDHDGDGVVDFKEMTQTRRHSQELRRQQLRKASEMDDIPEEPAADTEATAKDVKGVSAADADSSADTAGDGEGNEASNVKVPFLQLDLDGLADVVLHCHYVTRP